MMRAYQLGAMCLTLLLSMGCASSTLKLGTKLYKQGEYAGAERTLSSTSIAESNATARLLLQSARRIQADRAFASGVQAASRRHFEEARRHFATAAEKDPINLLYVQMLAETDGLLGSVDARIAEAAHAAEAGDIASALLLYAQVQPFTHDRPHVATESARLADEGSVLAINAARMATRQEDYAGALRNWAIYVAYRGLDREANEGIRQSLRGLLAVRESQTVVSYIEAGAFERAFLDSQKTASRYPFSGVTREAYRRAAEAYSRAVMKTAMEHERIARVLGSRADAFTAFERAMLALSIAVEPHPLAAEVDQCRETLSGYLRVDIESLEGRLTPETVPALWALRRELMKVAASEPADHVNQAALTRFVYESSLIHLVIPTGQTDPERDLYTRFDEALEAARLPFLITHRTDDGGSIVRMVESRLNALATQVGLAPSMAVSPRVFVVGSEIATRGTPIREELEQFGYRVFEDYVRPVGRVRRESLDLLERELKPLLASLHSLHTELTADHQDKLQEREEWRNRQTAEEQVLVLANGIESAQQEFLNLLRRNELLAPLRSAQESLGTINGLRNALDVQLRATAQTRRANDEAELTSLQRVTEHRALISETRIRAIDTINNAIARFPQDVEARHIDMVARRSRHLLPVEARVRLHLTDTRNQQRIDLAVQADRRDYEATAVEEIPTSVVSAMVAQWMSNPDPSGAQEVLRLAVSRRSFGDAIRSLVEMLHESRERTGDGWRTLANKAAFYVLAKGTEEGWQDDHQTDLRAFEELSSELSRLIAAGPRP